MATPDEDVTNEIIDAFTAEGFARRVEAELSALNYPYNHLLRLVARGRMNHSKHTVKETSE